MGTKKHECSITFNWDEGPETSLIDMFTPKNVATEQVQKELEEGHDFLCFRNKTDIYGTLGRTPETLAMYVSEKNGWSWKPHKQEILLEFD